MQVTQHLQHVIQQAFPGVSNKGLRAKIRNVIENDGNVVFLRRTVGLTAQGIAGLMEVANRVQEERNKLYVNENN